jgi:hypothetical protein
MSCNNLTQHSGHRTSSNKLKLINNYS